MVNFLRRCLRTAGFFFATGGAIYCTVNGYREKAMTPDFAWIVGLAAFVAMMGVLLHERENESLK